MLASLLTAAQALENGLARTPPMGWLAWERFRCNTDCKNDPDNCISDRLFRTMADIVVTEGYAAVGYEYINIDDCWLEKERGYDGQLVPDRQRFPYGMKSLANYVHSKGLKFGIYEDFGNYTCAGYPGVLGYLETDALTFASWDVDYVKLDGCYSHPSEMDRGYPEFGYHLNRTGRPMIYSCSWPVYQIYAGMKPNFTAIIEHCNLWRNFDDIQDSWSSLESIIDYYGNNQDAIIPNAGPGHWNDPDMLIIGNFGLSYEQSKTQMALWAILAAPLLMSVDLRTIRPEYKAILQNKKIIAVDQDPLGIQGRRIYKHKGIEIWARPISPVRQNYYSYAIAFLNRRTDGTPSDVSVTLKELGLQHPGGYTVEDLYEDVNYGVLTPQTKIKVKVNPSGVVILRCDLHVEDIFVSNQYTEYSPLNQVFKVRQNSFEQYAWRASRVRCTPVVFRASRLFDLARVLRKLAPSVLGTPQRKTDGEDRGKAILCVLCRTVNKSQAKRDRDTLALKARKIATFSEVCKGEITSRSESAEKERKTLTDMTCCQGLQSYTSAAMTDSGKTAWAEQTESSCRKGSKVACGMLPTLRALASKGGDSRDTTCLVPFDAEMDSASHLQMILLEAYCRETGVKVLRVSRERLRNHLCPGSGDLSCVLIANDDPFFLETPE